MKVSWWQQIWQLLDHLAFCMTLWILNLLRPWDIIFESTMNWKCWSKWSSSMRTFRAACWKAKVTSKNNNLHNSLWAICKYVREIESEKPWKLGFNPMFSSGDFLHCSLWKKFKVLKKTFVDYHNKGFTSVTTRGQHSQFEPCTLNIRGQKYSTVTTHLGNKGWNSLNSWFW